MSSASSGIGTYIGPAVNDPARPSATAIDTQTLLIIAAVAAALFLLARK